MSLDRINLLRDPTSDADQLDNRLSETVINDVLGIPTNSRPSKVPQYFATITATFSAIAAGAVLAWTSPILTEMENGHFHQMKLSTSQIGWIGSFTILGALVACFPTGFICDAIGRKRTLLLLTAPFVIGWLLIIFAEHILMLYVGRLITGLAVGACCVAVPIYINEIAEKDSRGTLGSYYQLMITVGIFLAYLIGKYLNPMHYTIVCGVLPLIFFVLFIWQPESPVYCLKKGDYTKAERALQTLRGKHANVQNELHVMDATLKCSSQYGGASYRDVFRSRPNRRAFVIALALMFFQQFSGINAVIMYTSEIFAASKIGLDAETASVLVGAFQVLATFASSLLVDRLGRRAMLIASASIMALSTGCLALFFTLKFRVHEDVTPFGFVPVMSLCLFIVMFAIGFGPVPWVMAAELFRPEIRSMALSCAATVNWLLAFFITKFYLELSELLGQDSLFYVFAITTLGGCVFVWYCVPETKGKSIDEIQFDLEN